MKFISTILGLSIFALSIQLNAQISKANLNDDFTISTTEIDSKYEIKSHKSDQLTGWPKTIESNPSFKNSRGVCLEDINGDGSDEIIFCGNSKVYAFDGNCTKLWEANVLGTAIYPPSAADINNDGEIEIVQITGGSPSNGHIHVFDNEGNELDGWPQNIDNNWLICSPALADLDSDLQLEILVAERRSPGRLHIFKNDGTAYSDNWPVELDGYPGVTPSIAYDYKNRNTLPNSGLVDSLIVMCSTSSLFAFDINGNEIQGFPVENIDTRFSYQSPLICKEWRNTQIIGATHGDAPEFYSFDTNGEYSDLFWSQPVVDNSWTYCPPIALGKDSNFDFFIFGQPGANETTPNATIHAFNPEGDYIDGFPYTRIDGLEGFITAMYSTDLTKLYIFTGSNMKSLDGIGYIHAYEANTYLDDFQEMPGFPIEVQGFTFMNGVDLGDVNNNGKLDLVALSYDLDMADTDSLHVNIFELPDIDYNPDFCFGTYKGNNLRNGYITPFGYNTNNENQDIESKINVYPSFVTDNLNIESTEIFSAEIYNTNGVLINKISNCEKKCIFNLQNLTQGMYFVRVSQNNKVSSFKVIKLK